MPSPDFRQSDRSIPGTIRFSFCPMILPWSIISMVSAARLTMTTFSFPSTAMMASSTVSRITSLRNPLEVILDTVDEAIMAVDGNENVVMVNRAAETMLMIDQGKIIGQKLNRIVPGIDLSGCLKSGEGIRHELKSISEKHYFLNANVIRDEAKSIGGMVATLQPI